MNNGKLILFVNIKFSFESKKEKDKFGNIFRCEIEIYASGPGRLEAKEIFSFKSWKAEKNSIWILDRQTSVWLSIVYLSRNWAICFFFIESESLFNEK